MSSSCLHYEPLAACSIRAVQVSNHGTCTARCLCGAFCCPSMGQQSHCQMSIFHSVHRGLGGTRRSSASSTVCTARSKFPLLHGWRAKKVGLFVQVGHTVPAPGNRITIFGKWISSQFAEERISEHLLLSQVATTNVVNRYSEYKLGLRQIMTCQAISSAHQLTCATTAYDRNLSGPNADTMPVAVAEFRGPVIHGLVQFVQLTSNLASIEATFDGLNPGVHIWSVNEYGDLTRGPESTGSPYNPPNFREGAAAGELGSLQADSQGHAKFKSTSAVLHVADIIGRSVVVYDSASADFRIAAAVIARSAGSSVSSGRQTLCKCDGTVVWDSEIGCV